MSCTKCNNSTDTVGINCGCKITLDTNCINYSGDRLGAIDVNRGASGNHILRKINDSVSEVKADIGAIKSGHLTSSEFLTLDSKINTLENDINQELSSTLSSSMGYTDQELSELNSLLSQEINDLEQVVNNLQPVIINDNTIVSTNPPSGIAPDGTEWVMYKDS